jgi:hypothetical protein
MALVRRAGRLLVTKQILNGQTAVNVHLPPTPNLASILRYYSMKAAPLFPGGDDSRSPSLKIGLEVSRASAAALSTYQQVFANSANARGATNTHEFVRHRRRLRPAADLNG